MSVKLGRWLKLEVTESDQSVVVVLISDSDEMTAGKQTGCAMNSAWKSIESNLMSWLESWVSSCSSPFSWK